MYCLHLVHDVALAVDGLEMSEGETHCLLLCVVGRSQTGL